MDLTILMINRWLLHGPRREAYHNLTRPSVAGGFEDSKSIAELLEKRGAEPLFGL